MTADRKLSEDAREGDPSEWSSRALTRRLADYLVNAYTDGRGYDPADLDDVEVTLRDGFDIVLGEMRQAQRDRSDGGGSEDSTTASEYPATAEPPSAPVTASAAALGSDGWHPKGRNADSTSRPIPMQVRDAQRIGKADPDQVPGARDDVSLGEYSARVAYRTAVS